MFKCDSFGNTNPLLKSKSSVRSFANNDLICDTYNNYWVKPNAIKVTQTKAKANILMFPGTRSQIDVPLVCHKCCSARFCYVRNADLMSGRLPDPLIASSTLTTRAFHHIWSYTRLNKAIDFGRSQSRSSTVLTSHMSYIRLWLAFGVYLFRHHCQSCAPVVSLWSPVTVLCMLVHWSTQSTRQLTKHSISFDASHIS